MEIFGSNEFLIGSFKSIRGFKGENITIACRSDLESLTLEYQSVVYNHTKNSSGIYTVALNKVATQNDNSKLIKCRATNATGAQFMVTGSVLITGKSLLNPKKICIFCLKMGILKIKDYTKKKRDEHIILICSCIYLQF